MYKHITQLKTISVDKGSDTMINESINVPRRSTTGLLFYKPYVAGAEYSEKTFNPNITEMKAVVDRILNRVYSQEMGTRNIWEEVLRRFGKENSTMNATDFYAGYRFSLSSISGVWETMTFMQVDWDLGIQKKEFSLQLTGKCQAQRMWNITSSSSQMLSSTSSTESLKVWLITEIISHLKRHSFDRRTNQSKPQRSWAQSGTPWLLHKRIKHYCWSCCMIICSDTKDW